MSKTADTVVHQSQYPLGPRQGISALRIISGNEFSKYHQTVSFYGKYLKFSHNVLGCVLMLYIKLSSPFRVFVDLAAIFKTAE